MIDNSLVFQNAGTILSYFFPLWPVIIVLTGIGWRRQFLTGMIMVWVLLLGIWLWTQFGTTKLPSILLAEPWNTILFFVTGVFLFLLLIMRQVRRQNRR